MTDPTIEPLGDQAWLLRWAGTGAATNRRVHAVAALLRAAAPAWRVDLVPGYATLAVFFDRDRIAAPDPGTAVRDWLAAHTGRTADDATSTAAREVRIPVCYGGDHGPDLDAVAAAVGLPSGEVVRRHAAGEYLVAMLGFSPGFPYLLGLEPALAMPRRATPRLHVPAGSVGIGGAQTGLYPDEGPGGWQLIGRTPLRMFDPAADPPSRLLPGDRVRFEPIDAARFVSWPGRDGPRGAGDFAMTAEGGTVEVLATGVQTTVQDAGRFGWRHLGVGAAGALDPDAARIANLLVGNPAEAAVLEVTWRGPRLRFDRAARIALVGAGVDARAAGVAIPGGRPVVLPPGCELAIGACRDGARAWIAVAGGLQVPAVLGSAATDLRAGFGGHGGRALAVGDVVGIGAPAPPVGDVATVHVAPWWVASPTGGPGDIDDIRVADRGDRADGDGATPATIIHVLPGRDALADGASLHGTSWRVTAQSNRQGLRLQGGALATADTAERRSEPVAPGTVQLPPDGQPIVLLAEAQTIGGYPRIGHVASADLPRLAQLRPGDTLRFACIDADAAETLACARRERLARMTLAIERRLRDA